MLSGSRFSRKSEAPSPAVRPTPHLRLVTTTVAGSPSLSTQDETKDTSEHRVFVRDVIIGTLAVTLVAVAVPAWLMHAEYRKSHSVPVKLAPTAEVLRDTSSATLIVTPPAPDIPALAERIVRREAEKRASAHAPSPARTDMPVRPAKAPPAQAAPTVVNTAPAVVNTPQFGSQQSAQSP